MLPVLILPPPQPATATTQDPFAQVGSVARSAPSSGATQAGTPKELREPTQAGDQDLSWAHGPCPSPSQGIADLALLGQEAGEGWWGWVLGLHDSVLFGGPVHSVYDHSPPLPPHHSLWSFRQRPEVSHKYSSLDLEGGAQLKRRKNKM